MKLSRYCYLASSALVLTTYAASAAAQSAPAQSAATDAAVQKPQPAKAASAHTDASADIVVTGARKSMQSAQNLKRNADQIVDAVVAEDIGKLPDITVSESLARITGVQVTRAAAEAADVQVRGLPDLSTTYDGREIFTASGRQVALQDFAAGAVAALEVYKSSTADLIEGGIAGQINVRSRKPFDFTGLEISGDFNRTYAEQAHKPASNGELLISDRWHTGAGEMGLLVNIAYTRTVYLEPAREQSENIVTSTPQQSSLPPFRYPDGSAIFYGQGDRLRPSVNAAFQWQPGNNLELYADGMFQGYRGRDADHYLFVPAFGNLTLSNVVIENGDQAQSATISGAVRPEGFQSSIDADTNTYQFGGGAIWNNHNGLKISADLAHTYSTYEVRQANIDFNFASSPDRNVVFDAKNGDGGPAFSFINFNLLDPDNYIFRGLYDLHSLDKGAEWQARTDVEYETPLSFIPRIQFGLRYSDRTGSHQFGDRYSYQEPNGIKESSLPIDLVPIEAGFSGDVVEPTRVWLSPTRDSIRDNIEQLRALVGFPAGDPPYDPLAAYSADEKAYTAYAQVKYAFDLGIPIDGLIGLRAVKTHELLSGTLHTFTATGDTITPITQTNSYTDYLPNVSARLSFTNKLLLRLAYTETRTRPDFDQLSPSTTLFPPPTICDPTSGLPNAGPKNPECIVGGYGGNPYLKPLTSKNYDASLEYYYAKAGYVALDLFRRNVKGFIDYVNVTTPDPVYAERQINEPVNEDAGRLQGAEASFQGFLNFEGIPAWARGFGAEANYTYIDGTSQLAAFLAAYLPGQQPVSGVSKHAYNLAAIYDQPAFSARLSYNWRGRFVEQYELIQNLVDPRWIEGLGQLDFSASVTPTKNVTIAFDASNLLGAHVSYDRPYDEAGDVYPVRRRYLERVYSVGVRFRL